MRLLKRLSVAFAVIGALLAAQMPGQHSFSINGPAMAGNANGKSAADDKAAEKAKKAKAEKAKAKRKARRTARRAKAKARVKFRNQRNAAQDALDAELKDIYRKATATGETGPTWRADMEEAAYARAGRAMAEINTSERDSIKKIDETLRGKIKAIDSQPNA